MDFIQELYYNKSLEDKMTIEEEGKELEKKETDERYEWVYQEQQYNLDRPVGDSGWIRQLKN